jgi:hypothetical protein
MKTQPDFVLSGKDLTTVVKKIYCAGPEIENGIECLAAETI